jgi:CPA1 family monovalent cation:H+ antiporter
VLASTGPVAVSALGRRLSLPPKVQALVQAESLFNDATSLVLFQIAVSLAVARTASPAVPGGVLLHGAGQFAVLAAGGAAAGGVIAAGVIPVRRRVTDPVLETVLALITPYAAYVASEVLHVSPVMAVMVAGLAIGARRDRITTAQTRLQLHSVYQTVIFLLESVGRYGHSPLAGLSWSSRTPRGCSSTACPSVPISLTARASAISSRTRGRLSLTP